MAAAVAEKAMESGVARRLVDPEEIKKQARKLTFLEDPVFT